MEIVDTITVMKVPIWMYIVTMVTALVLIGCMISNSDSTATAFIGVISFILTFAMIFIFLIGQAYTVPDHEEYVVRITDMPAVEFARDWEVTKEYKYTDVIQVKKRSGGS